MKIEMVSQGEDRRF